jgi:hypothetical protein
MFFLLKLLLSPKTLLGIAVGAGAAWFADPERGAERRANALDMIKQTTSGGSAGGSSSSYGIDNGRAPEPALWTPNDPPAQPADA